MRRLSRLTPHGIALLAFVAFYILLICDVRHWSWRDPGSYFFDPQHAFDRVYSLQREAEAEKFITSTAASGAVSHGGIKAGPEPSFCVGIPTVQRDGARYFRRALGSVLEGLSAVEREDLWIMPFIVNLNPEEHQAYQEPWLKRLSDQVLTYSDAEDAIVGNLKELMVGDTNNRKKALFDYTHLLKTCYEKNMTWTLILEDDTVAADGWYLRIKNALHSMERKSDIADTIYLRGFYNERLLGWNSEEWFGYMIRAVLVEIGVLLVLVAASRYIPLAKPALTPRTITTITFVLTPLCITLFFLAGRLTVAGPSEGISRMDSYGCCSQAFVFPREQIPGLLAWYEQNQSGYIDPISHADRTQVDSLTEVYADQHELARYALTPSVFQHVGGKSTKPTSITRWGRSNTENIWNFSFERLDGGKLKREHII